MAEVTGFTAARMLEIENSTIIGGYINNDDNLLLYTRDGRTINAGHIKGGTAEWIRDKYPEILNDITGINTTIQQNQAITEEIAGTVDDILQNNLDVVDPFIQDTHNKLEELPNIKQNATDAAKNALDALIKANESVSNNYIEYAVGTSRTDPPETGWTTDIVTASNDEVVWFRIVVVRGDGDEEILTPALLTGHDGPQGEDAVTLYIESTKGTAFKNNQTQTQLNVTIYQGSTEIKNIQELWDHFGPSAYLEWGWLRINDDEFGLISSSDDRLSRSGFTLNITPDDVDSQTTFRCVLNL